MFLDLYAATAASVKAAQTSLIIVTEEELLSFSYQITQINLKNKPLLKYPMMNISTSARFPAEKAKVNIPNPTVTVFIPKLILIGVAGARNVQTLK